MTQDGPPGGYRSGLKRAEAELVYQSVRKTLAVVGFTLRPERSPANAYQAQRLDNAYTSRDLDPTLLDLG
jgi:hypothetical protein